MNTRNSENDALEQACFELARTTKWTKKPIDSSEISELSPRLMDIARSYVSAPLAIDIPLITKAVRYLTHVHAIPPMGDDTRWFQNMLAAVLEIARPNSVFDEQEQEFLRDMLDGITKQLNKNWTKTETPSIRQSIGDFPYHVS